MLIIYDIVIFGKKINPIGKNHDNICRSYG